MTRRKRIMFGFAAVGLAATATIVALAGVDVFLHGRFERSAGYNVWGYRGPRVGAKRPGEVRIVMLGGSSAFGYGVTWDQAIPAHLERVLSNRSGMPPVSVVNLGYNNEGSYSLRFTLEDYRWLDYDVAVLYEGYNDLNFTPPAANFQVFRHESPVFRLTGYLPIFPIIFREKAAALLAGAPGAAYSGDKTVFRPGLGARGAAGVLTAVAGAGSALENQLGHLTDAPARSLPNDVETGCSQFWSFYCRSMLVAAQYAIANGARVLIVGQPHLPPDSGLHPRHLQQQEQLAAMLQRVFDRDDRMRYVDLGEAVNLTDPQMSFDLMHLSDAGNQIVAARLAEPVAEMLAQVRR